jgi:putative ABC transport system ATP-binding protein
LRPLSEVSPLMLALIAVHFGTILPRRASSRCTQPDSNGMLCAADSESPSTSTVFGAAAWALPMPHRKTNNHRHRRMSDSSRPLLEACDVSKSVSGPEGRLEILSKVSLRIPPGESFAIVGASGSGKTTLLGLLAGLDTPDTGRIALHGHALEQLDEEARADLRRRLVGFVFQSFHLLPALTAEENVMLPLELEGSSAARQRAREALDAVGLTPRRRHYPAQLSGGEQQRVAIARALVNDPFLVIADEPTGNLDERATRGIFQLLREINAAGTAVIMATHNLDLIRRADLRTIELNHGRIVYDSADPVLETGSESGTVTASWRQSAPPPPDLYDARVDEEGL